MTCGLDGLWYPSYENLDPCIPTFCQAPPIYQPENLKNPIFLNKLNSLNPDLFVVVAFRMLPEILINIPKLGTINLHSSLLPDYRGAAPINWVIINGEKETGVTTFFINKKIEIIRKGRITSKMLNNALKNQQRH